MFRWRRLLRPKSSVDLTIVALVLCVCVFVFRHLNERSAVHSGTADDDDEDDDGRLLEINLNDHHQQQQQQQPVASPTQVELVHRQQSQHARDIDQRITNIGDFRSAECQKVNNVIFIIVRTVPV